MAFASKSLGCGSRTFGGKLATGVRSALFQFALGLRASFGRYATFLGWRQLDSCAPSFRKPNRNGLLGRSNSVLAFANVMHLFAHEFTCLGAGRPALLSIFLNSFEYFFFWHVLSPWFADSLASSFPLWTELT
jgi:hypothetical protein